MLRSNEGMQSYDALYSKLLFIFGLLLTLCAPAFASSDSALCKIRFNSMSKTYGAPGDTFEMYGTWEETQGSKTAGINMGKGNKLEIISWSNSVIKVRIPEGLRPGIYRVGVYCNNPPHWQGSTWKDFEVTGSGTGNVSSEDRPLIDEREKRFERKEPEITQRTEVNKPLNEDDAIGSDAEETMKIGIAIIVFIIMAIIFIARKRSVTTITLPHPKQSDSSGLQTPQPWTGVYNGVEYAVECLGEKNGEPFVTVYIGLPALLSQRLEVNARKDRPPISDKRAMDINALLDMGVDYIDISFNTNWIAAEVPVSRAKVDKNLAEKIVKHLIHIRDLSQ